MRDPLRQSGCGSAPLPRRLPEGGYRSAEARHTQNHIDLFRSLLRRYCNTESNGYLVAEVTCLVVWGCDSGRSHISLRDKSLGRLGLR